MLRSWKKVTLSYIISILVLLTHIYIYIYMSNELNLIWRVQYSLGSTMALTECILREDLALLADQVLFLFGELQKLTLNILTYGTWKKFLARFNRIFYLENLGWTSASHPVANFPSCHARVHWCMVVYISVPLQQNIFFSWMKRPSDDSSRRIVPV